MLPSGIVGSVLVHSMFLNEDEVEELNKQFPNGVKVCVVNEEVADA